MGDAEDRRQLLLFALQTAPPSVHVTLPRGADSLENVDLRAVDVPTILPKLRVAMHDATQPTLSPTRAQHHDVLIDLTHCSVLHPVCDIKEDPFNAGWRDFAARMVPDGSQPRVVAPEPPVESVVDIAVAKATAVADAVTTEAADAVARGAKSVKFAADLVTSSAPTTAATAASTVATAASTVTAAAAASAPVVALPNDFDPIDGEEFSPTELVAPTTNNSKPNQPTHFDPFEEAIAADESSSPSKRGHQPGSFPKPIHLQLRHTQPMDLFSPLIDDPAVFSAVVYDSVLLGTDLFLTSSGNKLAGEVLDMVRPSLGIGASGHKDAIRGLTSPQLATFVDGSIKAADIMCNSIVSHPPDGELMLNSLTHLRRLMNCNSGNKDFVRRTTQIFEMRFMDGLLEVTDTHNPYPFLLRALLFAGILSPLHHDDATFAVELDDVAGVIPVLQAKLKVSDEVGRICRVHSIILSHRALEGSAFESTEETQQHFFDSLVDALDELDPEESLPDLPPQEGTKGTMEEVLQYREYVLQEVLNLCAPQFIGFAEIQDKEEFQRYCKLFVAACIASGPKFLNECFGRGQLGDLSHGVSAQHVTMYLLSHILCTPLYKEMEESRDTITADIPLTRLVETVIGTYDGVAPYAQLMTDTVPNAPGLVIPGIIRMLSPALFAHWQKDYEGSSVPLDLLPVTQTIHDTISALAEPHTKNKSVMANVHGAVEDLDWISALLLRRVSAVGDELDKLLESLMMGACWWECKLGDGAHSSSLDLFSMFHQMLPPLATCIAPMTNQLTTQYINSCLRINQEFIVRVCGPLHFSDRVDEWELSFSNLSGFMKAYKLNTYKAERMKSFFTQLDLEEVVLRLNTLLATEKHLRKFIETVHNKHEELRQIVGGDKLEPSHLLDDAIEALSKHINDICEFLAMRLVYKDLKAMFLEQFYLLDMKWYKQHKHNKKLLAEDRNGHLIFVNDITIKKVMDLVDSSLMVFLPFVTEVSARELIVAHLYNHFAVAYYGILLDGGEERYFYPEQHEDFFNDVCYAQSFFEAAASPETQQQKRGPWAAGASMVSAIRVILSMIMSEHTDTLIHGGGSESTAMKFSDLPEHSHGGPHSKHIVRSVLAHRKDQQAKKFTAQNPQPK